MSLYGFPFRRVSMSDISDEDRAAMTHVFRGAQYEAKQPPPVLKDYNPPR